MAFGDLRGNLTASVNSVTNPTVATGSVVCVTGDLVFVVMGQQTALTAASVTDNLGNTYSAVNAGNLSTVSARCFYSRVTAPGTLTAVNVAATASANDASVVAAVIEGPFLVSPLDANPANTTDATTPFNCPPTGTLAQADEAILSAHAVASNQTLVASSPGIISGTVARANVSTALQRRVVAATTTVTPVFTGTSAAGVQVTASFKKDTTLIPLGYQPLSTPVWRKGLIAGVLAASGVLSAPVVIEAPEVVRTASIEHVVPWQRVRLYPALQQPVEFPVAAGNNDVHVSTTIEPVPWRHVRLYPAIQQPVEFAVPEVFTVDKWHRPFDEPVRRKPQVQPDALTYGYTEVVTLDRWHAPLSIPVRRKGPTASQQKPIFFDPLPVTVADYAWYVPLSEPTRRKAPAPPTEFDFDPFPRTVEEYAWYRPLAEPTRREIRQQPDAVYYSYFLFAEELVTLDKWFARLSEPTRSKPRAQPPSFTFGYYRDTPGTDDTRPDQWWRPLSEPTLRKPTIHPDGYWYGWFFAPEVITLDRWFRQFSEPTRREFRTQPPAFGYSYFFEIVSVDKWFVPLSKPTLRKQPAPATQFAYSYFIPAPPTDSWWRPLAEPTRREFRQQPHAISYGYFFVAEEIVTLDKWFRALDLPNRREARAQPPSYSYGYFIPAPSIATWWRPLDKPTLREMRAQPDAGIWSYYVAPSGTDDTRPDQWWRPLSEPTRRVVFRLADGSAYFYSVPELPPQFPPRTTTSGYRQATPPTRRNQPDDKRSNTPNDRRRGTPHRRRPPNTNER